MQQRADLGQVLQRGKLGRGAALGVAAVRQDLAGDLLRQEAQGTGQEAGMLGQRDGGGDQPFQGGQRARVEFLSRQGGRQAAGVADQAAHQPLTERVVGRGEEEIVVPEPGGDPRAGNIRPLRDRIAGARTHPVGDQRTGSQAGRVGAQRAQVAEPVETVGRRPQQRSGGAFGPGARPQGTDCAAQFQLALEQPRPTHRVARPGVADRQGRRIGNARHPQAGKPRHGAAGVAQPATRVGAAHPLAGPRKAAIA